MAVEGPEPVTDECRIVTPEPAEGENTVGGIVDPAEHRARAARTETDPAERNLWFP